MSSFPPKIHAGADLVLATHNPGKVKEIRQMLSAFSLIIHSSGELNLMEPEETGTTFHENARLKALQASKATNMMALADDSGFCLNGLNGDPGLYSARWAGPDKNYLMAMQKMHDQLASNPDKTAYFICVLSLAFPDGKTYEFEGRINGHFVWPPRGHHGHGYDPVFQPLNNTLTFAEMTDTQKNEISHRALAFQKFIQTCF